LKILQVQVEKYFAKNGNDINHAFIKYPNRILTRMNYIVMFPSISQILIATAFMIMPFGYPLLVQQQVPNPGFESWDEIRSGVLEPAGWNSLKSTEGPKKRFAPDVCFRSEIAHSGKYALRLVNKTALGIVANGMLTNGAINGSSDKDKSYVYTDTGNKESFTAFTSKPDSIVGWYSYTPQSNDSAMVVLLLHTGAVTLPDKNTKQNWLGGVKLMLPATQKGAWVRFSAPLKYYSTAAPQYLLMVLSAGNRKKAVEGSEALFDDLQLIYN